MPIQIEEFLKPISPDQPCGADLRYAPISDQIKEARRQDDEISQGVWKTDLKTADYPLVMKLAKQAFTKQGKDLQVAAWLTEALLARDGVSGLRQGLELIRRLLEDYWDSVHPLVEDEDFDMRATPLRWVGSQLSPTIYQIAVTPGGVSWVRYRDSRKVPTEADAMSNPDKGTLRQELLEDGKLSPEDFEKEFENIPPEFYESLLADIESARQMVSDLSAFCDERFGEDAPDYGPLRTALEEVGQTVRILCVKKGGRLPGQEAVEGEAAEEIIAEESAGEAAPIETVAAVPERPTRSAAKRTATIAEPQNAQEALERIAALAHYLRRENPGNPVPYLVLRAVRWGELRATGPYLDPSLAQAPATETRVELKRLSTEGEFEKVIHLGEQAMAEPCGRAWLDLQRYVVRACRNYGQTAAADAICSQLKGLLADYPQLADSTLHDDTPAANAETRDWLREENLLPIQPHPEPVSEMPAPPQVEWAPPPLPEPETASEAAPPDTYQLAVEAARSGRADEAIRLMLVEICQAPAGRARFLRRSQLAQICLMTGNQAIALPILREMAGEMEQRRLDDWESPEILSQPLAMLYCCLQSDGAPDTDRAQLYARICRLDPLCALNLPK